MPYEFRLVDIGEGLTEAEIVSWLVAVGDHVVEDQPVVEIETDKAVVEMPAPATGIVGALGGDPGQVIAVGELLVTIDEDADAGAPAAPLQEARELFEGMGAVVWLRRLDAFAPAAATTV